jgi:DNA helicase-2/ATP-dependent DNA helicase PcrA
VTDLKRGGLEVTQQQADVIDHVMEHPVTAAAAGAGAGKTRTLVAAVLEPVERRVADANQFVLITFTREAADELRRRIDEGFARRVQEAASPAESAFWAEQQERVSAAYIGTIHGFCRHVLANYGYQAAATGREFGITFSAYLLTGALAAVLDTLSEDQARLLLEGVLDWQPYHLGGLVREIMESMRNRGLRPEEVLERTEAQPQDPGRPYRVALATLAAEVERHYRALKAEEETLDSGDLLECTAQLLCGPAGARVAVRLRERFRYLFIDEFQDTDRLQYEIADRLRAERIRLLVVGDRKQEIYNFRATDGTLLDLLAQQHQGRDPLPLNVSWRPTAPLLGVQNALFRSVGRRYPRLREPLEACQETIVPRSGLPPLTYLSAPREDRIPLTARYIRWLLDQQIDDPQTGELRRVQQGDIVLLVRSNFRLDETATGLQAALQGTDIKVRRETGGSFFQQPEIVSVYQMLRLVLRYPDDTALSLALRTPYLRAVNAAQQELRILQYRVREGSPLADWLEDTHPEVETRLREIRAAVRSETVPPLLARLYEAFEIRQHYRTQGDLQALENLEKLREIARRLFQEEQALTLRQFVDYLQLAILSGREESEAPVEVGESVTRPPYVRIMTIHRAKGLEFPLVIIPGAQSPLMRRELDPRYLIDDQWGLDVNLSDFGLDTRSPRFRQELARSRQVRLEEEMRIFYVAVTRAQHAVTIIGGGAGINRPGDDFYAWKDEVLAARTELLPLGAHFPPEGSL